MSLPAPWIDKIFTKLTLAYGRDFIARWEGIELNDVKSDWGHELAGFAEHPEAIAYALANLPPKAPSVIEFRALARRAPLPEFKQLPAPKADERVVAEEMAKQLGIKKAMQPLVDGKEWARRLLARHESGERIRPYTLQCARQALGIEGKQPWQ